MRKAKRFLGIILSMILLCAMSISTFAAETGKLTINSSSGVPVAGRTFNIYRIFDATIAANGAVSYQWNADSNDITTVVKGYFSSKNSSMNLENAVAASDYVLGLSAAERIEFAEDMHALLKDVATTATKGASETDTAVEFTNLSYGYYLIYDATVFGTEDQGTVRSAVMLSPVSPEHTITIKAGRPTIDKKVNDLVATSANLGDTVTYTITATVPDMTGYDTYTFNIQDTAEPGISIIKDSVQVAINGIVNTTYTPNVSENVLTMEFGDIKEKFVQGDKITITYSAMVADTILTKENSNQNINIATLTYSNDPSISENTGTATAYLYTYNLNFTKVDKNSSATTLKGAEFKMYRLDEGGIPVLIKFAGGNGEYTVSTASDALETVVSAENGKLLLKGLKSDKYRLEEITAPDGYKLPSITFGFSVKGEFDYMQNTLDALLMERKDETTADWFHVFSTDVATKTVSAEIRNLSGSALPETGGIGTTIFTMTGIVLMICAAAYFVSRKRVNN